MTSVSVMPRILRGTPLTTWAMVFSSFWAGIVTISFIRCVSNNLRAGARPGWFEGPHATVVPARGQGTGAARTDAAGDVPATKNNASPGVQVGSDVPNSGGWNWISRMASLSSDRMFRRLLGPFLCCALLLAVAAMLRGNGDAPATSTVRTDGQPPGQRVLVD